MSYERVSRFQEEESELQDSGSERNSNERNRVGVGGERLRRDSLQNFDRHDGIEHETEDIDGGSLGRSAGAGAGSGGSSGKAIKEAPPDPSLFHSVSLTLLFIGMWYIFSVSISVYNKWMFGKDGLNFNFPVISTSFHQFIQFILAIFASHIRDRWNARGQQEDVRYSQLDSTPVEGEFIDADSAALLATGSRGEHDSTRDSGLEPRSTESLEFDHEPKTSKAPFNWQHYFRTVLPCAVASAGDIGLGNLSFRVVTLTFYTMVKSSHLGFVLVFSVLFRLEAFTVRLAAIVFVMTVGVIMMVAGETEFQLVGFFLVLGAAMCSGLRWSLTQILLKQEDSNYHGNPITTIKYLSPLMGAVLFFVGCLLENPWKFVTAPLWAEKGVLTGVIILIIPGTIAFFMTLSEFFLLNQTSVLTLSIAGIFKEVVTLITAHLLFGDQLTVINVVGILITFVAIMGYNWYRYDQRQKSLAARSGQV